MSRLISSLSTKKWLYINYMWKIIILILQALIGHHLNNILGFFNLSKIILFVPFFFLKEKLLHYLSWCTSTWASNWGWTRNAQYLVIGDKQFNACVLLLSRIKVGFKKLIPVEWVVFLFSLDVKLRSYWNFTIQTVESPRNHQTAWISYMLVTTNFKAWINFMTLNLESRNHFLHYT